MQSTIELQPQTGFRAGLEPPELCDLCPSTLRESLSDAEEAMWMSRSKTAGFRTLQSLS